MQNNFIWIYRKEAILKKKKKEENITIIYVKTVAINLERKCFSISS